MCALVGVLIKLGTINFPSDLPY